MSWIDLPFQGEPGVTTLNGLMDDIVLTSDDGSITITVDGQEIDLTITPDTEFNKGNITGATTIDFEDGKFQKAVLTGNVTLTFDNPPGAGVYIFRFIQDATGNRTVTLPADARLTRGQFMADINFEPDGETTFFVRFLNATDGYEVSYQTFDP